MKYKLLSVSNGPVQNIGDYIQALAASQFLPSIDGFINREELASYDGEECKMIMNGWFMHHPEKWPPSNKIKPLFVAFHLNESVKDQMLSDEKKDYFCVHEPIGCRDLYTASALNDAGISAYFSGCLTLTLGLKYKKEENREGVIVVDPMIPGSKSFKSIILDFCALSAHYSDILKISRKMFKGRKKSIVDLLYATRFYRCYSKWIDKGELINATYIQQETEYYTKGFKDDFERLKEAERIVKIYAKAKYVLTSRIHCALPCLGLETPVYFSIKEDLDFISSCRMGGLIELFNYFTCSKTEVYPSFELEGVISSDKVIMNKNIWQALADQLATKCKSFVLEE